MDFRGGDRRINPYMAEYIKNVNEGKTEWQRRRELLQKIALYGAQAGLTGLGGYIQGQESKAEDEKNAARHSREAYAKAPIPDYKPMGGDSGNVPAWLGHGGEGDVSQTRPVDVDSGEHTDLSLPTDALATQAQANAKLNSAARDAAIATWYTPPGLEAHANETSALVNDHNTAMDEMSGGGMMSSLPKVQR